MRKRILLILAVALLCGSCEKLFMEEDMPSDAVSSFNYLWQKVDQQYAFFDVKGVDWDSIYNVYIGEVGEGMGNDSLFRVMSKMLNTLNDGHVNLISSFDVMRCHQVYERMVAQSNIDVNSVILQYLTVDYHSSAGFRHHSIRDGEVAYIYYPSFSNSAPTATLYRILQGYPNAKGAILDIRQNGGGNIENVWNILKVLPSEGKLLYYTQIKNGPGHDDFTTAEQVWMPEPDHIGDNPVYDKPVVVLTDRGSYSAASFFALCSKRYDNVTVVGDTTGGGLGLPAGGYLPNGWRYRFSITRTIDYQGVNWENGVPPDEVVLLDRSLLPIDNVIERACDIILDK